MFIRILLCRAALKWEIRNRKETENQNPESTNKKKKFFKYVKIYCAELLPLKKQENK